LDLTHEKLQDSEQLEHVNCNQIGLNQRPQLLPTLMMQNTCLQPRGYMPMIGLHHMREELGIHGKGSMLT